MNAQSNAAPSLAGLLALIDREIPHRRTYTIDPRRGFGWKLALFENGVEVGGGVFDKDEYCEALQVAEDFVGEHL